MFSFPCSWLDDIHLMPSDLQAILKLRVPVIVCIGQRRMRIGDVLSLAPGSIVELGKAADDPLDLLVNNQLIGQGTAVKVGEHFGLWVTAIGDPAERISAIHAPPAA